MFGKKIDFSFGIGKKRRLNDENRLEAIQEFIFSQAYCCRCIMLDTRYILHLQCDEERNYN
jgi:hypothetical protein